jgi:hypothetical protein
VLNGDCIGGYTNASWTSPEEEEYKEDKGAFVFNLTTHAYFPCKDPSKAIRCYRYEGGPCFGYSELLAFGEPFGEPFN